jgi:hypothetical protein
MSLLKALSTSQKHLAISFYNTETIVLTLVFKLIFLSVFSDPQKITDKKSFFSGAKITDNFYQNDYTSIYL